MERPSMRSGPATTTALLGVGVTRTGTSFGASAALSAATDADGVSSGVERRTSFEAGTSVNELGGGPTKCGATCSTAPPLSTPPSTALRSTATSSTSMENRGVRRQPHRHAANADVHPSGETSLFETSLDYLVAGVVDDKSPLKSKRLIDRMRALEDLATEQQEMVISLIDAVVAKSRMQAILAPET